MQDMMITPDDFCEIISAVENKKISKGNIKQIIDMLLTSTGSIEKIIEKFKKAQDDDQKNINSLIDKVINDNPKQVEDYKKGKTKILGFFVGQVLKNAKDSDPGTIKEKIIKILDNVWKNGNPVKTYYISFCKIVIEATFRRKILKM